MDKTTYCVACALEIAAGRRHPLAGPVTLIDGVCPECGNRRGVPSEPDSPDYSPSMPDWLALPALRHV
jgi:hypothetical protein